MPVPCAFDYAVVRLVPHVEREEFVNAGIILFCPERDYLAARIELDEGRLLALAPDIDLGLVRRHLDSIPVICAGGPGGGAIGELPRRERWHWLVAPSSALLQTSAPHVGVCEHPERSMERLIDRMVRRPRPFAGRPLP